jgi:hydroxymethylpyrimidine pyrophosphatase-like HAD family hydrolase
VYVLALATDYDGTIAQHGLVDEATIDSLTRFKQTGRRLVLVTGRALPDLLRVFPSIGLFDRVVVENGALLYDPKEDAERVLSPAPPDIFVERLRQRGVSPLTVGPLLEGPVSQPPAPDSGGHERGKSLSRAVAGY